MSRSGLNFMVLSGESFPPRSARDESRAPDNPIGSRKRGPPCNRENRPRRTGLLWGGLPAPERHTGGWHNRLQPSCKLLRVAR